MRKKKGKLKNRIIWIHYIIKGYNLANDVDKCAMQYLTNKDFTVFNPYSLFVNPVSLNNHDVNNIFNFVKGLTFFLSISNEKHVKSLYRIFSKPCCPTSSLSPIE